MPTRPRLPILCCLLLLLSGNALAQDGQSQLNGDLLSVPRIDVTGYGALSLELRLIYDEEYLLVLESSKPASLSTANAGVFDEQQMALELTEVVLESGDRYALELALYSDAEQLVFSIAEAIPLATVQPAPDPEPSPAPPVQPPSGETATEYLTQCAGCHGDNGLGTSIAPALTACANCGSASGLANYIRDTMPLGMPGSCDIDCASALADYILAAFNADNDKTATQTVGFIELVEDSATLRRAANQLASRLPRPQEYALLSQGDNGLRQAVDRIMQEEAFYERLSEIFNDYLLTDKYHSRNGSEAAVRLLSSDDFPNSRWFDPDRDNRAENYEEVRQATNDGIAREPLALINHVVRNNLPFTEILTADYLMVNPFSARSYGVDQVQFNNPNNPDEYQPARLPEVPHAGILTSPMFLNRYPTTETNRNRGRARVVFDLFLDTDILAIEGVRPGNAVDITTPIPTINNPDCATCHSILDPVASTFQNWDYKGRYRPARLSKYGWYTDMEVRGFNGEAMPLAGNVDSSLQWLGQQIAADPKFPRAVTRIVVTGLTGKEPLKAPSDPTADPAAFDAYVAERTVLNDIQASFVNNNYNLKRLIRELILSPYWRAGGLVDGAGSEAHALTGASYLLTPEQLGRKIEHLLGFEWRGSMDSYYKDKDRSWTDRLGRSFHQIYGGIDSDSVTTRLRTPNGMMGAMQLRMANELACYAVPHDLWLPEEQRRLFLFVDADTNPYDENGELDAAAMAQIRLNIQYLHEYLLDERLALGGGELAATEALFMTSINRGRQYILNNAGEWRPYYLPDHCDRTRDLDGRELEDDEQLRRDPQFVVRSWMAVLAYLLADYKFLYQ